MTPTLAFHVKIAELGEAITLAEHWATHLVSLLDPNYREAIPRLTPAQQVCRQYFHDITPRHLSSHIWQELHITPQLMQKSQVEAILTFTEQLPPNSQLLVHCHAGISRSTATTCGILCQHGLSPQQAWAEVFALRPIADPNPYILQLFDDCLGLGGSLQQLAKG
jgi:predicted protein tyrosine phosphatase